jgi:hypothetical protein
MNFEMSKLKLKNNASSNENFIIEVHWNLQYIYKFLSFKWCEFCKKNSLKIHFTFEILVFWMDFFINHMFRDIHRLTY